MADRRLALGLWSITNDITGHEIGRIIKQGPYLGSTPSEWFSVVNDPKAIQYPTFLAATVAIHLSQPDTGV